MEAFGGQLGRPRAKNTGPKGMRKRKQILKSRPTEPEYPRIPPEPPRNPAKSGCRGPAGIVFDDKDKWATTRSAPLLSSGRRIHDRRRGVRHRAFYCIGVSVVRVQTTDSRGQNIFGHLRACTTTLAMDAGTTTLQGKTRDSVA